MEAELLRKWEHTAEPAPKLAKPPEPATAPTIAAAPPVSEKPAEPVPPMVAETSAPVSEPAESTEPKAPTEIGRGSQLHRDTQRRIKSVAEELGFRATLEAQVGGSSVDLLLERAAFRIAVEFSSTTGVTHELQNILKCFAGDYSHIALVCADPRKLQQVETKLRERVSENSFSRVGFYEVEPFLDYLRGLSPEPADKPSPPPKSKKPSERKIMGWTVTAEVVEQTDEEQKEAKARTFNALGEALRKPPKT